MHSLKHVIVLNNKSSLVFFVTQDSQFSRMTTDYLATDGQIILLAFNQIEECLTFIQENPILVLIHLNHCSELTSQKQKLIDEIKLKSNDTKIYFVIPTENEYLPIENYISMENVVFKSGDMFKEMKELIISAL